jgi:hypothetical protein
LCALGVEPQAQADDDGASLGLLGAQDGPLGKALKILDSTFKEYLSDGKHSGEIKKGMAEGQKAGIRGTLAFLLGFVNSDGKNKRRRRQ